MDREAEINEMIEQIQMVTGNTIEVNAEAMAEKYEQINSQKTGLAIKVISILGGFIGSLAFVGFLLIGGLYNSSLGLVITGILFIAFAIISKKLTENIIIDTSAIAFYCIGYALIAIGLTKGNIDESIIAIVFIVLALFTIIVRSSYLISFLSVLLINSSLIFLIIDNNSIELIHFYNAIMTIFVILFVLKEAEIITKFRNYSEYYDALKYGLILSLVIGYFYVGNIHVSNISQKFIWLSSIITIPATMFMISEILDIFKIQENKVKILIYLICFLLLASTAISPAISGSLLIILISFYVFDKIGISIGVISFIYFIIQFYYDLTFTLLTKSILMFLTGILFLAFYFYTNKWLNANEKI